MKIHILILSFLISLLANSQTTVKRDTLRVGDSAVVTQTTNTVVTKTGTTTYSYKDTSTSISQYKISVSTPPPTNLAPTARAGNDTTITLPSNSISLNASKSTDPEGQILKFYWRKVTGPVATLVDTNKAICIVSGMVAGTYVFELRAIDPLNLFSVDFINVVVNSATTPPTGNPVPFSFTAIPSSDPDLVAPGRGAEQWHDRNDVNVPIEGTRTIPRDRYQRFVATRIAGTSRGSYNWSFFDNLVRECIANNQRLSFGVMTVYGDGNTSHGLVQFSDGAFAAYPEWLHNIMMANSNTSLRPWKYASYWIPNYNSIDYSNWILEFNKAIDTHIKATTYNGVAFKNVVNVIDIRGVGNWGEWHHYPYVGDYPNKLPAGRMPTFESLKRIVDAHIQGFPDNPLVAMISAHDRERLVNTWNPPAISDYIATARNNWGGIGYRNDHWGGLDTYTWDYLDHPALANVWKFGYITGEPPGSVSGTNNMGDLVRQMTKYHVVMVGNGNMGDVSGNTTVKNNFRAASKATGYRIISTGGSFTPGATSISITNNWQNVGISPTYEDWYITYELVNSSGVVTTLGVSSFKLKLFLPSASVTHTDILPLNVSSGIYTLRMSVKDPTGYRQPLTLAIQGRNSDGSYNLKTFTK
jgi:hypothetical protein